MDVRTSRMRAVRLLWTLLGAAAVLPLLAVDPAVAALLLDADFLALLGVVGLTLLRRDGRALLHRLAVGLPVLWVRVGVSLTRGRPASLLSS